MIATSNDILQMPRKLRKEPKAYANQWLQECLDDSDINRLTKHGLEAGFWTRAWEEEELEKNLYNLVNKNLIKEMGNGRYHLTEFGNHGRRNHSHMQIIK